MPQLKITQTKSVIGEKRNARESLRSLGLKRIHQSVVVDDSPIVQGYLRAATHLVAVEPASGDSAGKA